MLPTNMAQTDEAPFYGSVDTVKARPGWSSISAVQNNRSNRRKRRPLR